MSDLVKRLRDYELSQDYVDTASIEAPKRIEALESACRMALSWLSDDDEFDMPIDALQEALREVLKEES